MKRIILDTDLDTDCDDAGALGLLHNLQTSGACTIVAVICNAPVKYASLYARVVNAYMGRPQIAVGTVRTGETDEFELYFRHRKRCEIAGILYNQRLTRRYVPLIEQTPSAEDAVKLYRKVLANSPDKSVNVCSIGLLNVLAELMRSGPCRFSPLEGSSLIKRKVDKLVVMGKGKFPSGKDTFNWRMAPEAASLVLNNWPGKLVISPVGDDILTGRKLMSEKEQNPIADAYKLFLKPGGLRPSWDPVAVLYSVLGEAGLFKLRKGLSFKYCPQSGIHKWQPSAQSKVYLLEQDTSDKVLTDIIDDLLVPQSSNCCPGSLISV